MPIFSQPQSSAAAAASPARRGVGPHVFHATVSAALPCVTINDLSLSGPIGAAAASMLFGTVSRHAKRFAITNPEHPPIPGKNDAAAYGWVVDDSARIQADEHYSRTRRPLAPQGIAVPTAVNNVSASLHHLAAASHTNFRF